MRNPPPHFARRTAPCPSSPGAATPLARPHLRGALATLLAVAALATTQPLPCRAAQDAPQVAQTAPAAANAQTAEGAARAAPQRFESVMLADRLARYGLQQGDPWALVAAARLYRASGTEPSSGHTPDASAAAHRRPDNDTLLRQARRLADDQPELLALIDRELSSRPKAALFGPQAEYLLVAARDTWTMLLRFVAGRPAMFGIKANRLEDLKLVVQGSDGKPLCEPALRNGELLCSWQSTEAAEVRIEVANRGNATQELLFFHE